MILSMLHCKASSEIWTGITNEESNYISYTEADWLLGQWDTGSGRWTQKASISNFSIKYFLEKSQFWNLKNGRKSGVKKWCMNGVPAYGDEVIRGPRATQSAKMSSHDYHLSWQ